jgi:histidyl-tRNA synthetase
MQDLLPKKQRIFRHIEDVARQAFDVYGYAEIGMPIIEDTNLFQRSVGENTDIVEKEMYSFDDRNGESLTLRPEGTAGCVRLAQENGLLFNQTQRFWYSGPMFRYERPQKGRYRQFSQIGGECFGMSTPDVDAELLLVTARIWQALGVLDHLTLELNSLGNADSRMSFEKALVEYLTAVRTKLDSDSLRRLDANPLRILDSKVESTQELLRHAPRLLDYIDRDSLDHFNQLKSILDSAGLAYEINPTIVRGLDYYNRTVFEWTTRSLGAQGTVCGGGRYDGLAEILGGRPTPAVGFAIGMDRLALLIMETQEAPSGPPADVFIASIGSAARTEALLIGEEIRELLPGIRVTVHCGEGKFKAQLKKADTSGAEFALLLGGDELAAGQVSVKALRQTGEQYRVSRDELPAHLAGLFSREHQH